MTELPPAVARYIADADPFVRGTDKAVDAAKKFDRDASKAAISARRMGLAAKEAGEKAAAAGKVAAEAAEKAAKGMVAESEAARLAARAVTELERAELAQAAAALASAEASEKAARAHRAQAADGAKATKSASLMRNELVTLGAAGAAVAPAFIAAGAGVSAFGALAFPTIKKVVESQEKMAETWDGLSDRQKVASTSTRMLVGQYKALSEAVEPDVLRVYNNALAITAGLMPRLTPLTKAASGALLEFENKVESALNSDRATQFFKFVEAEAGPAMDVLGDTLGSASHLAVSLTESLAPLAGAGLGVVGMVADLTAGLTDLSPELAQLAVLGIGLRGPLGSAAEGLGKVGEKYKSAAAGANGAGKATKFLNVVTAAGPNIYMAAGLAIGYFALKALNAKSSTTQLAESINVANRAVGNNLAGYVAANRALDQQMTPATQRAAAAAQTLTGNVTAMNAQMYQGAEVAQALTKEWVAQAKSDNDKKYANVRAGAAALSKQYNITAESAVRLATAAGVDMSKGILEGGKVSASAAAKLQRYRDAVTLANNPTLVVAESWKIAGDTSLGLKLRMDALNDAMNAYFVPAMGVLSATNRMREALAASGKVLKDSDKVLHSSTSTDQAKAAALRSMSNQLEVQLGPLAQYVSAQLAAKRSVGLTDKALRDQFPSLLRLSKGSAVGKAAVDGLVHSMEGTITRAKNATTIVDKFGNQVKILPSGKVTFVEAKTSAANEKLAETKRKLHELKDKDVGVKAKTGQANSAISGVQGRLNNLHDKTISVFVKTEHQSDLSRAALRAATGATGGLVTGSGIRRAEGGPVDGPGTETSDSIPAWLSKNEYVINARSTKKHLGLIEAINADKFAEGGMVGYARGGRAKKNVTHVGGVEVSTTAWRNIGLTLGKEFFKAMTGSKSEIASMDRRLEKAVAKLFAGKRTTLDNRLIHYLDRNSSRLEALSVRRDAATKALAAGKQYASQITSNARSFAGLSSLDGPTSGAQIRQGLQMKLSGLTQYAGVLKALGKRGLSKSLLRQVMDMGPEDGLKYGQMLLSADKGTFKDINAVQAQVDKTSRSLGRTSADMLYDAGKNAGKGFLTGLNAELKRLDKTMDRLALRMSRAIKKSLHIKSPSQLPALRQAGAMTVAGVAAGMDANLGMLDQSAARMAARLGRTPAVPRPVMRAPSVPLSGRGAVVQQVIHVHVAGSVWAERDLFQVVQRQALQHNRRNTSNGLSLTGTRG